MGNLNNNFQTDNSEVINDANSEEKSESGIGVLLFGILLYAISLAVAVSTDRWFWYIMLASFFMTLKGGFKINAFLGLVLGCVEVGLFFLCIVPYYF